MMRRTTYEALLRALRRPGAFSRLVDALPPSRAKWGLQCWGLLHGYYHGGHGGPPPQPGRAHEGLPSEPEA